MAGDNTDSLAASGKHKKGYMNHKIRSVFLLVLFQFTAPNVYAYESLGLSVDQQECFSYAMIGMDSVINSRLGLPPEHALEISRVSNFNSTSEKFDSSILNVMLDAYLWKTSPHSYALKVFFDCASRGNKGQQHANNN